MLTLTLEISAYMGEGDIEVRWLDHYYPSGYRVSRYRESAALGRTQTRYNTLWTDSGV